MDSVTIKAYHISRETILIADMSDKIWLMGLNTQGNIGFGQAGSPITIPIFSGITLESDETITKFHAHKRLLAFYTSAKRLFISRCQSEGHKGPNTDEPSSDAVLTVTGTPRYIGPESVRSEAEQVEWFNDSLLTSTINSSQQIPGAGTGLDLLAEGVDAVTMIRETIFFEKDGNLHMISYMVESEELIRTLGLAVTPIKSADHTYFQLHLPFSYDQCLFTDQFVYIHSNNYHHILTETYSAGVIWLYFNCDFDIDPKQIHATYEGSSIYVIRTDTNCLYKYNYNRHRLDIYYTIPASASIASPLCGTFTCLTDTALFCDDFNELHMTKLRDYDRLMDGMIDWFAYGFCLILTRSDCQGIAKVQGNTLFISCSSGKYVQTNNGFIYVDENRVYMCIDQELDEDQFSVRLIQSTPLSQSVFHIYQLRNTPDIITDIALSKHTILIKSGDQLWSYLYNFGSLQPCSVSEIRIEDRGACVIAQQAVYRESTDEDVMLLNIDTSSGYLDRLRSLAEMLPRLAGFSISFATHGKRLAFGLAPKREFITRAMIEFAEKVLTCHTACTEFNTDAIDTLTDTELFFMGRSLHLSIVHTQNHLPIRLPLALTTTILGRDMTLLELEFFAKKELGEAFTTVSENKSDTHLFQELGVEDYVSYMRSVCKYNPDARLQRVCQQIARGFLDYASVINLGAMNAPTLDYYLSGEYKLDRELLISLLSIHGLTDSDDMSTIMDHMTSIIHSITESQLASLLKNWTGSSVVDRQDIYIVHVREGDGGSDKDGVLFSSCSSRIFINKSLFDPSVTAIEVLIGILTDPVTYMLD